MTVRKFKQYMLLSVAVIVTTLFAKPAAADPTAETAPVVAAPAAVVIDAQTGVVVYARDKDSPYFPASMTKLMTALLTAEYARDAKLDERIVFSAEAVHANPPGGSHIAMDVGETLTIREALYGILLESANEVCNALAEHISGNAEQFAKDMTTRAHALGAVNTQFKNAHGLHDEGHFTTAYDMALILKEALKHHVLVDIISTVEYEIPPTDLQPDIRPLHNSNRMIRPASPYYNADVIGGKTGFTSEAGNTLATYAKRDGVRLIAVVMQGESAANAYGDTAALLDYGFNQFEYVTVFDRHNYKREIPVVLESENVNAQANGTPAQLLRLGAADSLKMLLPKRVAGHIETTDNLPSVLSRSVTAGETIGLVTFSFEEIILGSVAIKAQNSIDIPIPATPAAAAELETGGGFPFINLLIKAIQALGILLLALIVWTVVVRTIKRKRRRTARYGLRRARPVAYRYKR